MKNSTVLSLPLTRHVSRRVAPLGRLASFRACWKRGSLWSCSSRDWMASSASWLQPGSGWEGGWRWIKRKRGFTDHKRVNLKWQSETASHLPYAWSCRTYEGIVCVCMCGCVFLFLSVLPSEELPGESGLQERLAIRWRAKTALPVFWKFKRTNSTGWGAQVSTRQRWKGHHREALIRKRCICPMPL